MELIKTAIEGCFLVQNIIYKDDRGSFFETYNKKKFDNLLGKPINFLQDNFSISQKGVLRGLHFQEKFPQGKLVSVLMGEIIDVAVDLRRDSKTFGSHFMTKLSDKNGMQLWLPEGLAHGFLAVSDYAHFYYKCTNLYNKDDEEGICWNDPDLEIQWPKNIDITLSKKDEDAQSFNDFINKNMKK